MEVHWKSGFETYFIQNSFGDKAFYDKKGNYQYSMVTYGEKNLPKNLRAAVC